MEDERRGHLTVWTNEVLDHLLEDKSQAVELETVSGDASFRRYFRARVGESTFIAVDSPPETEDNHAFVQLSNMMIQAQICAPKVYSVDYDLGFMLLVDLGDSLYLPELLAAQSSGNSARASELYGSAIDALVRFQSQMDGERLEDYSKESLLEEMRLFPQWFCAELLSLTPAAQESALIEESFDWLAESMMQQTQLAVHRDYHSRNLMILDSEEFDDFESPGVIDFQSAVKGAYSYDLVSLFRDCYISWPESQIQQWSLDYLSKAQAAGLLPQLEGQQLLRDMDISGLQRHLKVLGIFSRLSIRDQKSQFLADIPLVIRYFLEVSERYSELTEFRSWFVEKLLPRAKEKLELED